MTCYGCKKWSPDRHMVWSHLLQDWCCRGCIGGHKKLYVVKLKEKPLSSSNRQDTALVKPESQFNSERELLPFDHQKFTVFQEWAGCMLTQDHAVRVWNEVRKMLTDDERMRITTAWAKVPHSNRSFATIDAMPLCEIDRVCNVIRAAHQKK